MKPENKSSPDDFKVQQVKHRWVRSEVLSRGDLAVLSSALMPPPPPHHLPDIWPVSGDILDSDAYRGCYWHLVGRGQRFC